MALEILAWCGTDAIAVIHKFMSQTSNNNTNPFLQEAQVSNLVDRTENLRLKSEEIPAFELRPDTGIKEEFLEFPWTQAQGSRRRTHGTPVRAGTSGAARVDWSDQVGVDITGDTPLCSVSSWEGRRPEDFLVSEEPLQFGAVQRGQSYSILFLEIYSH